MLTVIFRVFLRVCQGCSTAKRGSLKPGFALRAFRWIILLTAHFRAHWSIPAAVTGGSDREDTVTVAVDGNLVAVDGNPTQGHGRNWSPEPTNRVAVSGRFAGMCLKIRTHRSKLA